MIKSKGWCDMFTIKYLIGREYVTGRFMSEESEFVAEAFKKISEINSQLFDRIPFKVIFTDEDPYLTAKEMRDAVKKTGEIRIYTGWSGHPFLNQEQNNVSRAVHDVFAHLVCGCPFTFEGEYTSYLEQRKHYPEWTWRVLFAEIPAQTCAYYFKGGFGYKQRAIEAPNKWLNWCRGIERDYSKNSIMEAIA
jgi:hypothetical protein